ncbi:hypothetical protein JZU54_01400, partial [bacterium]|nr:hypothetical protein [bacterium]
LVEQPMRTWTWITPRKSVGLLIVCVAPTLIVAFVTAQAVQFGWGQPWSMGAHVAMQRNCDAQPSDFGTCTWNPDGESGTVFLVGDSQSWALADGVIEAATNLGMATTVVSTNACPFVDPATAGVVAGPGLPRSS